MKNKESIILMLILVLSIVLFVLYEMGYINIYLSKNSVYAQIKEVNEEYIVLKSLKRSGGLQKSEEVHLFLTASAKDLLENLKVDQKIKFSPTKIEETFPPRVYTKSFEVLK